MNVILLMESIQRLSFLIDMEMCLKRKLKKMKVFDFTYPDDTYTYQVSLLSAGFESLDFYSFSIEELNRV